jgi:hypothetical protein
MPTTPVIEEHGIVVLEGSEKGCTGVAAVGGGGEATNVGGCWGQSDVVDKCCRKIVKILDMARRLRSSARICQKEGKLRPPKIIPTGTITNSMKT